MTSQLLALSIDATAPERLARFWSALLGWEPEEGGSGTVLVPGDDTGFLLRFLPAKEPKSGQNRAHFDLTSSSPQEQQRTVARALELGGRHTDVGQRPEETHVVLADPEGNEFCVIAAGNTFLAECGFVGALAGDGTREVGHFWSRALDWPLVWDQDEETAIRSPRGGPKLTWGGPPLMPRSGRDRVRFELVADQGEELDAEVGRLLSLGATRGRTTAAEPGWVDLLDPDGNEFRVRADRGKQAGA
jgi:hypothetical protein